MRNLFFAIIIAYVFIFTSCSSSEGNNPGTEYMPDMFHSIAYEANLNDYYYHNTWGTEEDYFKLAQPRKPIHGTIPRGFAGAGKGKHFNGDATTNSIAITPNGSVPYYYEDTEDERARAMAEITKNPYPITEDGLSRGKNLYDINCGICHGKKGDGAGYLYDSDLNPAAVYPAAPANFLSEEFVAASNGRYYHGIMYGKNVMGGYADKLSYEERWQVIHYIRSLQAKDGKYAYNEKENTLNNIDIPGASAQFISHRGAGHSSNIDGHGGTSHDGMMIHHEGGVHHDGGTHTTHGVEGMHDASGHGTETHDATTHGGEHGAAGHAVEEGKKKGNKIIEKAKEVGGKVKDGAKKTGSKIKDGLKKAGGKVKGGIKKAGDKVKNAGKKDGSHDE